jgi:hypothetical protein
MRIVWYLRDLVSAYGSGCSSATYSSRVAKASNAPDLPSLHISCHLSSIIQSHSNTPMRVINVAINIFLGPRRPLNLAVGSEKNTNLICGQCGSILARWWYIHSLLNWRMPGTLCFHHSHAVETLLSSLKAWYISDLTCLLILSFDRVDKSLCSVI